MLAPDDRSTLLELLAPPDGYELDCAVGTTYSLNLTAFLLIPTAMTLAAAQREESDGAPAPLELLESLRRSSGRITVFCQAGQISVPAASKTVLLPFLEAGTVPVTAPRGGVFHPKVWALRYADPDGATHHRILVLSRNLTFDHCWDTVLQLDEVESGSRLPGVGGFLRQLPGVAVGPVDPMRIAQVDQLATTLESTEFEVPSPFTELTFHALGLDLGDDPVPRGMSRALVVSPFLRRERLKAMDVAWDDLTVVSRPEELDATFEADDEPVLYRLVAELDPATGDGAESRPDSNASPVDLSGLHAKLTVADLNTESVVITGSANATIAAYTSNVEAVVTLRGPRGRVGVAQWLRKGTGKERRFGDLLDDHDVSAVSTAAGEGELGTDFDRYCRELAAIPVTARVEALADDSVMAVRYRSSIRLPDRPDTVVSVRPITLDVNRGVAVMLGKPIDIVEQLTIRGLTAFLAIDVRSAAESSSFVLLCELEEAPENRLERLLAEQIGTVERLLHYVMLLLMEPAQLAASGHGGAGFWGGDSAELDSLPVLELLARALTTRPERIREFRDLLRSLQESETDLVPDELWELCELMAFRGEGDAT